MTQHRQSAPLTRASQPSLERGVQRWARLTLIAALFATACESKGESTAAPAEKALPKPAESAPNANPDLGFTKEQAAQVLIKSGTTTVTVGRFAERLAEQSGYAAAHHAGPTGRRDFLNEMVRFEVMAAEAEKRGFNKGASAEATLKRAMVRVMMRDLFEKQGPKLSDVTDAEIKKYYGEHEQEFRMLGQNDAAKQFEDARVVIQNRLWRANYEAAIAKFEADLRNKADIQEDTDALFKLKIEVAVAPSAGPTGVPPKSAVTKK